MELAFIIIQIFSALFNNDKTTVFILLNAFKSISDTIGEGVMDNPQAQIDAIKAQVNAVVSQQFYRSIIIDSIDSAFGYDPVGCVVNIARCLVKHAESALEAVKEVEKYEVCLNDARSRKYLRFVSEVCSQKHMLLTQAGINAIESGERLQLNHLVSSNGYVSNSGIARMLLIALCDGAL